MNNEIDWGIFLKKSDSFRKKIVKRIKTQWRKKAFSYFTREIEVQIKIPTYIITILKIN